MTKSQEEKEEEQQEEGMNDEEGVSGKKNKHQQNGDIPSFESSVSRGKEGENNGEEETSQIGGKTMDDTKLFVNKIVNLMVHGAYFTKFTDKSSAFIHLHYKDSIKDTGALVWKITQKNQNNNNNNNDDNKHKEHAEEHHEEQQQQHSGSSEHLSLDEISDIYLGKQLGGLTQDHAVNAIEGSSFSIVTPKLILHLEANSPSERAAWVFGIRSILRRAGKKIRQHEEKKEEEKEEEEEKNGN